jgi:hypothetical protein
MSLKAGLDSVEKRKISRSCSESNPKFFGCLDHSPITILTEPSQLRKKNHFMNYGVKSLHEMNILGLIISKLMTVISVVNRVELIHL